MATPDGLPIVWFPWSGALFTSFFAHCWIDDARRGPDGSVAWVASDRVAIDAGPLMIAIENARSGFVWDLFAAHPAVRRVRAEDDAASGRRRGRRGLRGRPVSSGMRRMRRERVRG